MPLYPRLRRSTSEVMRRRVPACAQECAWLSPRRVDVAAAPVPCRERDRVALAVESARRVPGAAAEALFALTAWVRVWDAVVQHRGRGPAGGGVSSPPLR